MKTKIDLKFEEEVYKRYYPLVYTTCKRFLVDKCYLGDATQSVFLLYIKKEDQISSNLSSWFYWASVNICKLVNKDFKKHLEKLTSLDGNTESSEESISQEEFFLDLGGVLEKLPTKKRDMLMMRFYEHKTYREIGDFFKCKEDSARMMIERTLVYLKKEIKRKEVLSSSVFGQFFGIESSVVIMPAPSQFILQNSLLQQSFIQGVQKMYLISKLKVILVCFCFLIPVVIPLSNLLLAKSDLEVVKQSKELKKDKFAETDNNEMTALALKYLAEKQAEDGSWSDKNYKSKNIITALCCLAFMAEGSRPRAGKYGKSLEKGVEYLLSTVSENGAANGEGSNPLGAMQEHIFTSLVLLLCYQEMTWQPTIKPKLILAMNFLSRSQKFDDGWSFDFSREGYSNLHMTALVKMYIKMCKKYDINFPEELGKKSNNYVVKCAYPDGKFRYRFFGLPAINMNALGIIALNDNGDLNHPLIGPAKDRIISDQNQASIEDLKSRPNYLFDTFYDSNALYAIGDSDCAAWFAKTFKLYKSMQNENGALTDNENNTIYTTAVAAIVLQANKGKLPIYERGVFTKLQNQTVNIKEE